MKARITGWHQRMSAGSNLLLMTWLIVSLIRLPDLGYETVQAWLSAPVAAVPMILLVVQRLLSPQGSGCRW
jgi:succinate dehydrogenase / fumarate reductase membrane anchor subunit